MIKKKFSTPVIMHTKQNVPLHNIELNQRFQAALDLAANSTQSVFITGKAGTGKSTFLMYLRQTTQKALAVLAPTGVAALNVRGETIHSFFRFKPNITVAEAKKQALHTTNHDLYAGIDCIVIDEISMVRADLLDCVDSFLRTVLRTEEPFGGIQMIFLGDLYQLPPVVTKRDRGSFNAAYETPYFFTARVMTDKNFELRFIELEKIYRQSDTSFIDLLNGIRNGSISQDQLNVLNRQVDAQRTRKDEGFIYLTTTNRAADRINKKKLAHLKTESHSFGATVKGTFDAAGSPAPAELRLKIGAQIMFLTNNPEGMWVNGSIGMVQDIDDDVVSVATAGGLVVRVTPYTWTMYRYVYDHTAQALFQESIGSFTQYPLNLAWAVTVHKSQGKTFDRVIVDLEDGTFAHGQAYVALSRCRSLDGLVLKTPLKKSHLYMDYRVVRFLTRQQYERSEHACSADEKVRIINQAINNGQLLDIVYLKPDDRKSYRTVKPIAVGDMQYLNNAYVGMEAYCMLREETRAFRVDRILEITVLNKNRLCTTAHRSEKRVQS